MILFLIYENKSVNDIAERIHKDSCLISIIVNLHEMVVHLTANNTRTPSRVVWHFTDMCPSQADSVWVCASFNFASHISHG